MTAKGDKMKNTIKSMKWLFFWIGLSLLFNFGIYLVLGKGKAIEFLGGYLIELSLSIDNVFVFLMIFMSFSVKEHAQHRVLGWGIIGAIVLRFFFIFFGVSMVNKFEWILYVFGFILVYSGIKMFKKEDGKKDPHDSILIKAIGKVMPLTKEFVGEKFFVKENKVLMATPLFAVLILVESSDIMFAIDSVPAVLSVSRDLFIVYTSNIFAILGLRQLFFVIEHMQERFMYVRYGVAGILIFTGIKMALGIFKIHIPTAASIVVIISVLFFSILISALVSGHQIKKEKQRKNQ